jgi:hypothetical protein
MSADFIKSMHEKEQVEMSKLTTAERKKIPSSEFGLPDERKYPMPDREHAANAKSRASAAEAEGHITKAEEKKIDRKADHKLYGR